MTRKVIILYLIFCASILFGNLAHNQGNCQFTGECCDNCRSADASIVKHYIVESGFSLIYANSNFQQLLCSVELSEIKGVDYVDLNHQILQSIESFQRAVDAYSTLLYITQEMEYDPRMQEKLKTYDYGNEPGKLQSVWSKVQELLFVGDVKGAFKKTLCDCIDIVERLKEISKDCKSSQLPIDKLRSVNQRVFESQLFAQYCAEVYEQ